MILLKRCRRLVKNLLSASAVILRVPVSERAVVADCFVDCCLFRKIFEDPGDYFGYWVGNRSLRGKSVNYSCFIIWTEIFFYDTAIYLVLKFFWLKTTKPFISTLCWGILKSILSIACRNVDVVFLAFATFVRCYCLSFASSKLAPNLWGLRGGSS